MTVTDREGLASLKPLPGKEIKTVLVVEADPLLADAIAQTIKRVSETIKITTAQAESQCLEQLGQSEFDCVLVDPDRLSAEGPELIALIKGMRPAIPLIVMTSEPALAVRALEEGATGFFLKRGDPEVLSLLPYSMQNAIELGRMRESLGAYVANLLEEHLVESQRMASIGELTAGVVHDFNNLLATIILASQMIDMEVSNDSMLKKQVESIQHSAENGAHLAGQLLSLARGSGTNSKTVGPNGLIKEIVNLLRLSVKDSVSIELRLGPKINEVLADRNQVAQIILDLALNARDAMPNGGTLTLSTENVSMTDPERCRKLGIQPGDYVRISVSNTGLATNNGTVRKALAPLSAPEVAVDKTAFGLLVVQRIIERQHGALEVSSEPGQGTRFSIYLPSSRRDEQAESDEPDLESLCGTERILVVDDKDGVRESVSQMLALWGYEVVNAKDGASAIELYRRHRDDIDAVLMDLRMSGLDGLETYKQLKQIDDSVPVVLTSGYGNEKLLAKAIKQGVASFIKKPYKVEQLLSLLRTLLGKRPPQNGTGTSLPTDQLVTSSLLGTTEPER